MTTATLSNDALTYVCSLVRDRSAIELDASKSYLIEARLTPLAKQNGFGSITEFVNSLKARRQAQLEGNLVEAMTTNETSFYRDAHPFEVLRKHILPEMLTRQAGARSLNIWSAACSSGQEIYSIAMLIREHFPALSNWNLGLLGTDLSDDILSRAREAQFSQFEVNRGLPATLLVKHFQRNGMQWQLRPEIRAMATFRKLNLIESWPAMPTMDIVFLRNVLIYFSTDRKKQILRRIKNVMASHAVLFLGAAETTINLDSSFERIQIDQSVFYRLK